jgi:hypothetical protein
VGILHGLDCIFGCKPAHYQGQFAVGGRLNRKPVNAQYVLRSMSTAAVDFHNELDIFHGSLYSFRIYRSQETEPADWPRCRTQKNLLVDQWRPDSRFLPGANEKGENLQIGKIEEKRVSKE